MKSMLFSCKILRVRTPDWGLVAAKATPQPGERFLPLPSALSPACELNTNIDIYISKNVSFGILYSFHSAQVFIGTTQNVFLKQIYENQLIISLKLAIFPNANGILKWLNLPMWQLRPFKNASCLLRNSTLRPANEFEMKPPVLDEKNGFIYKLWWKKNQISYLLWFN